MAVIAHPIGPTKMPAHRESALFTAKDRPLPKMNLDMAFATINISLKELKPPALKIV
jgi:hypothetical protein